MATTYTLIDKAILTGSESSVDFTSIPTDGTYTDLQVVVSSRVSSTDTPILVSLNGSTSNFTWKRIYGNGSSASSQSGSDGYFFYTDTSAQTSSTFGSGQIYIPNYASSNYKSISSESLTENNGTTAEMFMVAALWSNIAEINQITFTPLTGSFVQYSSFYLYGIKNS
jgi:hypothetical protein